MSVNLQWLGRDKEAIARVWIGRPLGQCVGHFPLSPQQNPEPSGRRDSGYADGGNALIMFADMGGVTLTVGWSQSSARVPGSSEHISIPPRFPY